MSTRRVCIFMAFDSGMFHQARQCIDLLLKLKVPGWQADLVVLNLGLTPEEKAWLGAAGVILAENTDVIPNFPDAPGYMRAMTCRPYMRDLIHGYEVYMWVDADIRMVAPDALQAYVHSAAALPDCVVICQEVEVTYGFVRDPRTSHFYHSVKRKRIEPVYGTEIADKLDGFLCFNAGIFAMHRDSPIWRLYQKNLELAMKTPFDHMKEQDAMNVAILQNNMRVCNLSALYNWLCSSSQPTFAPQAQRWVRPIPPHQVVSVLHLASSGSDIDVEGKTMKVYDYYKLLGMTR